MFSLAFAALSAAGEGASVLPVPAIVYPLVAAVVFTLLAFVIWSFRDAANRHSHKTRGSTGRDQAHN